MNKHYDRELQFLQKCLSQVQIHNVIYNADNPLALTPDLEIRRSLGLDNRSYEELYEIMTRSVKPHSILYLTDEFFCQYILMMLPEAGYPILCIGPYIANSLSIDQLIEILVQKMIPDSWIPTLKHFYQKVPIFPSEAGLISLAQSLADVMWGEENYQSESIIRGLPITIQPVAVPVDPQKRMDAFSNITAIEEIYKAENELLFAISRGRSAKAKSVLNNFPLFTLEQRTTGIRNMQNYCIVMNTLFRKAAEQGGVHPLYLDQISSGFAHRIETMSRSENITELWTDMVQKYCTLVNKHNMQGYSLPVQKVITRVDFDLAADLSLKTTAEYLNVNASYLSSLFKKETGYTLTDYVNMKRMDHAAYLLARTALSISEIAQACGILDDNYFSKLFKRYFGQTPSQYRNEHNPLI